MGSVLIWMLGVIVFGMSVAMMRKPFFHGELMTFLFPLYQALGAAIGAAFGICIVTFVGCCGAASKSIVVLASYVTAMGVMFLYQIGNGSALIYYGYDLFILLQFVSMEVCRQTRMKEVPRNSSLSRVAERVSKILMESSDLNGGMAEMMGKYEEVRIDCPPIKDYITPTGAILVSCALSYIYLAVCAIKLIKFYTRQNVICNNNSTTFKYEANTDEEKQEEIEDVFSSHQVDDTVEFANLEKSPPVENVRTPTETSPPTQSPEGSPYSYFSACSTAQKDAITSPKSLCATPRPRPNLPITTTALCQISPTDIPTIMVQIPTPQKPNSDTP